MISLSTNWHRDKKKGEKGPVIPFYLDPSPYVHKGGLEAQENSVYDLCQSAAGLTTKGRVTKKHTQLYERDQSKENVPGILFNKKLIQICESKRLFHAMQVT
jgi:hypothetical protein